MKAEEWVGRFAGELGIDPPGPTEVEEILELAAVAAHASERIAAPVATWLAGKAGRPVGEVVELAARIAP
jgi:hypothetical protein